MLKRARLPDEAARCAHKSVTPIRDEEVEYAENRKAPVFPRNPRGGVANGKCSRYGDCQQHLSSGVLDYVHLLGDETHCGEQKKHYRGANEAGAPGYGGPEPNGSGSRKDVSDSGNFYPPRKPPLHHFSTP